MASYNPPSPPATIAVLSCPSILIFPILVTLFTTTLYLLLITSDIPPSVVVKPTCFLPFMLIVPEFVITLSFPFESVKILRDIAVLA